MILGIERIIGTHQVEPGRFYLALYDSEDPVLFQCVRMGKTGDSEPDLKALHFAPGTESPLRLTSLPHQGPVVALPEVHIRVDAPSLSSTNHTTSLRSGMFIVSGTEVFIAVPQSFREWTLINISTGRPVVGRWSSDWAAFTRWLLVIDDNGEEIPVASFGETEAT